MRLIPVGLGIVTGLQVVAAAGAFPVLTIGVGLALSAYGTVVNLDAGARTTFFLTGLPMAFGGLLMAAVFLAVPLGVCISGALVVGRLGCRRAATVSVLQLLKFGAAMVIINVAALLVGILFWPVWFYSEKLATLTPLWPLVLGFALNAALDAALAGIMLRSRLKRR